MDPRTSPRAEELHQRRRLHEMSCPSCNQLSPPPGLHSRAVPMLMGKCEEGKRPIRELYEEFRLLYPELGLSKNPEPPPKA